MGEPQPLCENCKAPYERKKPWQRFCSNQCRLDAWILKRVKVKVSFKSHKSTPKV